MTPKMPNRRLCTGDRAGCSQLVGDPDTRARIHIDKYGKASDLSIVQPYRTVLIHGSIAKRCLRSFPLLHHRCA